MEKPNLANIERFYLTNHDFNIFVNKGCQTYNRSLPSMLADPITREYYLSMQKGGCNEPRKRNDI